MSQLPPVIGQSGLERALRELQKEVAVLRNSLDDTGWIRPGLLNNWLYYADSTNTDNGWGGLQYRRKNGITYQRGLLTKTIGLTTEVVYNVPAGFRPSKAIMKTVWCAGSAQARLEIDPGGNIYFPEGVPSVSYVSMAAEWVADN